MLSKPTTITVAPPEGEDGHFFITIDDRLHCLPASARPALARLARDLQEVISGATARDGGERAAAQEHHPAAPEREDAPRSSQVAYSTHTGSSSTAPAQVTAESLMILPPAMPFAERFQLSRAALAAIINAPDDEWIAERGNAQVVVGGEVALALSVRDQGVILSIMPARRAYASRPAVQGATPARRGRGGQGTRYPTTWRELRHLAKKRGVEVELRPGGHYAFKRGELTYIAPSTASDYRSLRNSIKGIERELGVSLLRRGR